MWPARIMHVGHVKQIRNSPASFYQMLAQVGRSERTMARAVRRVSLAVTIACVIWLYIS